MTPSKGLLFMLFILTNKVLVNFESISPKASRTDHKICLSVIDEQEKQASHQFQDCPLSVLGVIFKGSYKPVPSEADDLK